MSYNTKDLLLPSVIHVHEESDKLEPVFFYKPGSSWDPHIDNIIIFPDVLFVTVK